MALPHYHHHKKNKSHDLEAGRGAPVGPKMPINISRPMGVNPQFRDYVKPPMEEGRGLGLTDTHPIYADMAREQDEVRMPEPGVVRGDHVRYADGNRF
jgi:hypothetical protein